MWLPLGFAMWWLIGWEVVGFVTVILLIGKPRRAMTPGAALFAIAVGGVSLWSVLSLVHHAS